MNIAIIGVDNIDDSTELSILADTEVYSLSRKIGYNLFNGNKTVKFKKDSTIVKAIEFSENMHMCIEKWLNTPNSVQPSEIPVKLNDDNNLFRSINNATILKPHVEGDYFCGYLFDIYDFKFQWFKDAEMMKANTGAVILQTLKQIENYNIIVPIKIKLNNF